MVEKVWSHTWFSALQKCLVWRKKQMNNSKQTHKGHSGIRWRCLSRETAPPAIAGHHRRCELRNAGVQDASCLHILFTAAQHEAANFTMAPTNQERNDDRLSVWSLLFAVNTPETSTGRAALSLIRGNKLRSLISTRN